MIEIWKDIKGYEGIYQVSNLGNIKSLKRIIKRTCGNYTSKEKILNGSLNKDGYVCVTLRKDNKRRVYLAHRIILDQFIPNYNNSLQINHINGIKIDNRICNLEWVTNLENMRHAIKNGLKKPHKLSDESKNKIRMARIGTKHSKETKDKMSKGRKGGNNANSKSIKIKYKNEIIEFDTIIDAANYIGVNRYSITRAINENRYKVKNIEIIGYDS